MNTSNKSSLPKTTPDCEIMDPKTWLWRKKSSEKTTVTSDKVNLSFEGNEEEALAMDKAVELDSSARNPNKKLSFTHDVCNTKDDLSTKHEKMAKEAVAGWEKADTEAGALKQELDEALQHRVDAEERLAHLDAALKECMQQLRFVQEEQEQRILDAVMTKTKEFEKLQIILEEDRAEASRRLSKLGLENTHLSKSLHVKEKMIEDLKEQKSQAETDFNGLMERLDSMEKDNVSMKYELRMLEKELEIRNEEREFNRRLADASNKQHLDSVKKIAMLESECQRLRLLVRKRLPGPAALAKMKNEVEMLERDSSEMGRRKLNPPMASLMVKDSRADNSPDTPIKRINLLTERLCVTEEENKTLKETLTKKNNELHSSRIMCARTVSKLSQVEGQLGELLKGRTTMELARSSPVSHELSFASIPYVGSDDEFSCTESWASALISELGHFRNGKQKGSPSCKTGVSDISLMDDFTEMEKLAGVSVDKTFGRSHISSNEGNTLMVPLETGSHAHPSDAMCKELVPVVDSHSDVSDKNQAIQSKYASIGKFPSWLQDILNRILEQNHDTKRSLYEILEEVRTALAYLTNPSPHGVVSASARENSSQPGASEPLHISECLAWKPPTTTPSVDSFKREFGMNISPNEISNPKLQSNVSKPICKLIELIEEIIHQSSMDYNTQKISLENGENSLAYKNSVTNKGYMVRVFQWKSSELSAVLRKFVRTSTDLLKGNADFEIFARELTSALDWIVNHCFSLQDVSSMKDTIKKHFDWDGSQYGSELEGGINSPLSEAGKVHASEERSSSLPLISASKSRNSLYQMEEIQSNQKEEIRRIKDELLNMESTKKDLERKLHLATDKSESLAIQLQKSEQSISSLLTELEALKESKGRIEEQIENHKLLSEDLDTQLKVARVELNEARQKFSSLEMELEDKSICCEDLEATCLELRLQLESVTKKGIPMYDNDPDEKSLRSDWEITAASEKLAECQETILNLGKQLKALASPKETVLLDKVISTNSVTTTAMKNKRKNRRPSLLDQMLAENDGEVKNFEFPETKEIISNVGPQKLPTVPANNYSYIHGHTDQVKSQKKFPDSNAKATAVGGRAIMPSKQQGGGEGLLSKLMLRKKPGSTKKMALPIAA